MKKSIWLAIIGAAALTGCQNEVMQQREYVPAPREDVEPARPAVDNRAVERQDVEPIRQSQDAPPAVQELPVMKGNFSDEVAKEDDPVIAKPNKKGGKKGAKGGKGGKKAGKGGKKGGKKAVGEAKEGEYVVRSGDNPEKIAKRHHVSAKHLRVGQKLVIPARSAGGKNAKGAKGGKSGKRAANAGAPAAGPGEYVVRSGDNPEKIAKRHHVRVSELLAANNLDEESAKHLRIGQKLVIPARGAAKAAPAAPGEKRETAPGTRKPGQGQGRDLEDDSNNAPAPAPAPAPEQPIRLGEVENGYLVEVPRDMTVAEFAKLNNVTEDDLRRLNPDMPEDMLKKERAYVVPKN